MHDRDLATLQMGDVRSSALSGVGQHRNRFATNDPPFGIDRRSSGELPRTSSRGLRTVDERRCMEAILPNKWGPAALLGGLFGFERLVAAPQTLSYLIKRNIRLPPAIARYVLP